MNKVMITGATGFVGSALVANLLAEDSCVVALSRSDPFGRRTRTAVESAATGFGLALTPAQWSRLSVVEVDFRALDQTLPPQVFQGVTAVWNAAAEMSYSLRKILDSVNQNVFTSSMLYKLTAQHAVDCRRFYHVSTAFTAGFGDPDAREEINFTPKLINAYQLSKWMAEVAIAQSQKHRRLPLTIFRPSIIIGHEHTGWSSGASFGMFLLAAAVLYARKSGASQLRLDLEADNRPNLVCIDTVVRRALTLLGDESPGREATEIFNCIGDQGISTADVAAQLHAAIGVQVAFGAPANEMDVRVNTLFESNKQFANHRWTFHAERLRHVLGDHYGPATVTPEIVGRSMMHYVAHQVALARAKAAEAEGRSDAA